jgi:AraC-like DNA-binding protein/predicted negative regulator of RcsB-dependent stress response
MNDCRILAIRKKPMPMLIIKNHQRWIRYIRLTIGIWAMVCIPRQGLQAQPAYPDERLESLIAQFEYKKALQYFSAIEQDSQRLADDHFHMYYLIRNSYIQYILANFEKANALAEQALNFSPMVTDSVLIAEARLSLAAARMMKGNFDSALSLVNQVIVFSKTRQQDKLQRDCLRIFGHLSIQNGKINQALEFYKQAEQITSTALNRHGVQADYLNLGTGFFFENHTDTALNYLYKAAHNAILVKDSTTLAITHAVIAACYQSNKNQALWQQHLRYAAKVAFDIQHPSLIFNSYNQLMEFEMAQADYSKAIAYGLITKSYLRANPIPLYEAYVDSLLYTAYRAKGQADSAIIYLESFHKQRSAILTTTQLDKINQLQHDFEIREKNLQITNTQLALDLSEKKLWLLLSLNVILLGLPIVFLLLRWFRGRYRNNLYQKEKMLDVFFKKSQTTDDCSEERGIATISVPEEDTTHLETFSENHKALYEQMIQLIESKKLYLNPLLDAKLVITQLGTNRTYLYNAINQHAATNFRNIINRYRVEEAKRLIEEECELGDAGNNTQIFLAAGFNAATTYYRTFKQHTGLTPLEYAREYLKDLKNKRAEP